MRAIRPFLTSILLAVLVVPAAGCSPNGAVPATMEAPPPPPGAITTLSYACASGREINVSYPSPAAIRLAYLGQEYALVQAPAATGARYVGADVAWTTSAGGGLDSAVLSRAGLDGSPDGTVLERCARPVGTSAPISAPEIPFPASAVPGVPPCRGPQLQLEDAGGDAGMGNRVAVVSVRNLGSAVCSLSGYPTISLVDDRKAFWRAYVPNPVRAPISRANRR
jgi:membrane-bound inhibitor of C-type lysozyme